MMMMSSDSDDNTVGTSKIVKTFVWCKGYKELVPTKAYCADCCGKMYKECSRCHLHYPDAKFFAQNEKRCNSCQKKYVKERERRVQKLNEQKQEQWRKQAATAAAATATTTTTTPPPPPPNKNKRKANEPIIIPVDDDDDDDDDDNDGDDDGDEDEDMKTAIRLLRRWKKSTKKHRKNAAAIIIL